MALAEYFISWFSLSVSTRLIAASPSELRLGEQPMFSLAGKEEEEENPENVTRIPRLSSSC